MTFHFGIRMSWELKYVVHPTKVRCHMQEMQLIWSCFFTWKNSVFQSFEFEIRSIVEKLINFDPKTSFHFKNQRAIFLKSMLPIFWLNSIEGKFLEKQFLKKNKKIQVTPVLIAKMQMFRTLCFLLLLEISN